MGRGRSNRTMVSGLALGLLTVVALSRLPGAMPAPPLLQDFSNGAVVASQGGEVPREPAEPLCALSGSAFEVHPERANEAWARVENTGAIPSTIEAIEMGWSGIVRLRQLVIRTSPTGPERIIFEGDEGSPAFAPLVDLPKIAPGEALEIGWRVSDSGGAPWTPNVAVLHLQEGCRTALRPIPAAGDECRLSTTPPVPVAGATGLVEFTVTNTSGADSALETLEIEWPVATNGALRAILVEGVSFKVFEEPIDGTPSAIALTRYRHGGIPLPSGGRIRIGFVFERAAADGPYVVTAATAGGCVLTATTWATPPDCGALLKDLTLAGDAARIQLHNPRTVARELRSIDLFWPAPTVGPLIEVLVDGESVWSGEIARSPASVALSDGIRVPARGSIIVHLRFRLTGAAGDLTGGLPPGAYTVVAGLDGGCRATLSTLVEPAGCNVSAGPIRVDSNEARISLAGVGARAALRQIALTWNPANGPLTGIALADTWLFEGNAPASTRSLTISIPSGVSPLLISGMPLDLRLRFEGDAQPDGYAISLSFHGPEDMECRRVWVSVPMAARAECDYILTDMDQDSIDVTAELTNGGVSTGEIDWIEFSWPNPDPLRPLVQVAVLADDGSVRNILWSGLMLTPPVRILPAAGADASIAPGERLTLRLRFAGIVEAVDDPTTAFGLTVGFVAGCRVHAVPADAPPPKRILVSGVVVGPLPSPLLSCCWQIQVRAESGRIERLNVAVDDATAFEPEAVDPRPGDNVTVEALVFGDGSIYAEHIRFHRATKQVRLVGAVQRVSPTLRPATGLPEFIVVLDRTISLADTTIVAGKLEVGAHVTVEGETAADGNVKATFIEVARNRIGELVEIGGIVQSAIELGSPGVGCSPQEWRIGAYRIEVPPDALPTGGAGDPCPKPTRGERYRVEGRLIAGAAPSTGAPVDTILADGTFPEAMPASADFEGEIVALPAAGLLGTWSIRTASGRLDFDVRSLAVVDSRMAPAEVGMRASVRVHSSAEGNVALRVRIDWGDG